MFIIIPVERRGLKFGLKMIFDMGYKLTLNHIGVRIDITAVDYFQKKNAHHLYQCGRNTFVCVFDGWLRVRR